MNQPTDTVIRTVFVAVHGGTPRVSFLVCEDVRAHVDAWAARNPGIRSKGWVRDPVGVHVPATGYTAAMAYGR